MKAGEKDRGGGVRYMHISTGVGFVGMSVHGCNGEIDVRLVR